MKKNPFFKGIDGIGPGPSDLAQARIRAMATVARQAEEELAKNDFERLKRQRERKAGRKQQDAILDALPEIKSWNPVPGSVGLQTPVPPDAGEVSEGRSESERSADKGSAKAQREWRREADRADAKEDPA